MENFEWDNKNDDKVLKWFLRFVILYFIIAGPILTVTFLYLLYYKII